MPILEFFSFPVALANFTTQISSPYPPTSTLLPQLESPLSSQSPFSLAIYTMLPATASTYSDPPSLRRRRRSRSLWTGPQGEHGKTSSLPQRMMTKRSLGNPQMQLFISWCTQYVEEGHCEIFEIVPFWAQTYINVRRHTKSDLILVLSHLSNYRHNESILKVR